MTAQKRGPEGALANRTLLANFATTMPTGALNVLFLSDRNAAYGLLAEAILRVEGNDRFRAFSAGIEPAATVDPSVMNFLAARHLPVEGLRPKSVAELEAQHAFQFVITLSDPAAGFAERHAWHAEPLLAHWALDGEERDAQSEGSGSALRDAFWTLSRRIRTFTSLPRRGARGRRSGTPLAPFQN